MSVIFSSIQAANLLSHNDLSGMTAFLKNIGANHSLRNRQFEFEAKTQYARAASLCEAASSTLQFPTWCPRQESNPHCILRKDASYPLNDGGKSTNNTQLTTKNRNLKTCVRCSLSYKPKSSAAKVPNEWDSSSGKKMER